MITNQTQAISLQKYAERIGRLINGDQMLQYVWITAETSDVKVKNGHCYLDLIEKDPNTGNTIAKLRAAIWASAYYRLADKFYRETGQPFCSDLKVMVLVTASYSSTYGLTLVVNDINGAYTLGDVMRRRNEIIMRLQRDGVINMNRELRWCTIPQRIAVISARDAAGYGDFINHLYGTQHNRFHLNFRTKLFTAALQGERTAPSIIAALSQIAQQEDQWDCVVIIRGGGATTDLLWFDNYELASNIAQFPIPVIIGIGHERDITVLDWVANMRVKTPTAAADWLISLGERAIGRLQTIASTMLQSVNERLKGCHQQLAYIAGSLPAASLNALARAKSRIDNSRISIASLADKKLVPESVKLDNYQATLARAIDVAMTRARNDLDSKEQLIDVLSPMSTLKRGYSITRVAGHAVSSVDGIIAGEVIETMLSDGTVLSTAIQCQPTTSADKN